METSVPDASAGPSGNLAVFGFPNQLAEEKKTGTRKTLFPMQIYSTLTQTFPSPKSNLSSQKLRLPWCFLHGNLVMEN